MTDSQITDIIAQLPERYIQRLRLLAANYRISVEDSQFVFDLIQDCNEALEKKDFQRYTPFDEVDQNPIGI